MHEQLSLQARVLWAKTGDESSWLSLHQHLLDAADIAGVIFDQWVSLDIKRALKQQTGLNDCEIRTLYRWLAGVHDIGKSSRQFQSQLRDAPLHRYLYQRVEESGLTFPSRAADGTDIERIPHSVISQAIIAYWLKSRHAYMSKPAQSLAAVAGAHHGSPPTLSQFKLFDTVIRQHDAAWKRTWDELLDAITAHTGASEVLTSFASRKLPVQAQLLFTGLVIMADWLASNTDLFPLSGPQHELPLASSNLSRVEYAAKVFDFPDGWHPTPALGDAKSFYQQRFGWPAQYEPNELQQQVLQLAAKANTPTLFVLEAPMGCGKTEAALALADTLAQHHHASGIMFGTPTTATSDGLFPRVLKWAEQSQPSGSIASLFLAHSRNTLNDSFLNLRYHLNTAETPVEEESQHGQVASHEWFFGRKKGLLSDIVIGTVDQILQMALQMKHVMLRHLALAGKVVIIDEAHAYDAYMLQYTKQALRLLASYGANVVLLSATLPQKTRSELCKAYALGLDQPPLPQPPHAGLSLAYPLITTVNGEGITPHRADMALPQTSITCSETDDDLATLEQSVLKTTQEGGCVAIICNTVRRAQEAYGHLKQAYSNTPDLEISLLHAQFTTADRKENEERLLRLFGPSAHRGDGRPSKHIVVSTQVIEQSLDLDFDFIITDFCPVDLLLQRAGRLHRHQRPASDRPAWAQSPSILVRGISSAGTPSTPPTFDRGSLAIYDEATLLASYAQLLPKLHDGVQLVLPNEISSLVQHTYGENPGMPQAWLETYKSAALKRETKINEKRNRAKVFLLGTPRNSTMTMTDLMPHQQRDVAPKLEEIRAAAQVRDIDPTLEVILIRDAGAGLSLLEGQDESVSGIMRDQCPTAHDARLIALNTVRLPHYFSAPYRFDETLEELERRSYFESWQQSPDLAGQLILVLDDNQETTLLKRRLRYSRDYGLQLLPETQDTAQEQETR